MQYYIEINEPHNYSKQKKPIVITFDSYAEVKKLVFDYFLGVSQYPIGSSFRIYQVIESNKLSLTVKYIESVYYKYHDYIVWIPEREMLYSEYFTKENPQ